jgi:hypothetical protein
MTWPSGRCVWPRIGPGKLPSVHPGNVFVSPVLHAGDWLCVHGLGLVHAIPLEQGEYKCLVRGVLAHRLCACWVQGSPRGFLLVRGCRVVVDGRSGDIPCKNVRGNVDSPQRNFGELVRLVVPAGHVIKLYVVELILEGLYGIAVHLHLVVVTARVLHDLVLTVNSCIKVRLDLQADKSLVVVKGSFFLRVVNPRYRIRGTNVRCKR